MKRLPVVLVLAAAGAGVGLGGCGAPSSAGGQSAAPASSPAAASRAPTAVTQTVTKMQTVSAAPASSSAAQTPAGQAPVTQPPPARPAAGPNVTDPWAVVSAYYGDIDSGDYAQAYALIGNGATTGQSYQQFAAGFACTGGQQVSENWESGDQVNFDLAAVDSCTGVTQYYTGTDTVENGTIVGADITQTA